MPGAWRDTSPRYPRFSGLFLPKVPARVANRPSGGTARSRPYCIPWAAEGAELVGVNGAPVHSSVVKRPQIFAERSGKIGPTQGEIDNGLQITQFGTHVVAYAVDLVRVDGARLNHRAQCVGQLDLAGLIALGRGEGSISFGCAFVTGRGRVPRPATGKTAFRIIPATAPALRRGRTESPSGFPSVTPRGVTCASDSSRTAIYRRCTA